MVDLFMVRWLPLYRLLTVLETFWGTVHNATLFLTVQIYIDYCLNVIFTVHPSLVYF
jgi:hypothetical protein